MKTHLIIPLLSLGLLFMGCSDDDDKTVAQPYLPKYVRQIRITENSGVGMYDFRYDEKQRISQCIEASTAGSELIFRTTDYTYSINKIYVDQSGSGEPRSYTIRRDKDGNAESLMQDDKTLATYLYNDNGYYYEKPSDKGWKEYEYLMKGEYSNLDKITAYIPSVASSLGEKPKAYITASFLYNPGVPQSINLDLSYFFISKRIESTLPLQLFHWLGKSSSLPSAIRWTLHPGTDLTEEHLSEYTYTYDKENYITQIVERSDGTLAATYQITYR